MSRSFHRYFDAPRPRRWQEWQRLLQVAPQLKSMLPMSVNEPVPPFALGRDPFLRLAACFADPVLRETLRALIFDLLENDLREILSD